MLQSDYKSQTFDNLADNRTPPADVAEAGLCLSSTLPIQSNMVLKMYLLLTMVA